MDEEESSFRGGAGGTKKSDSRRAAAVGVTIIQPPYQSCAVQFHVVPVSQWRILFRRKLARVPLYQTEEKISWTLFTALGSWNRQAG